MFVKIRSTTLFFIQFIKKKFKSNSNLQNQFIKPNLHILIHFKLTLSIVYLRLRKELKTFSI